jgi:hypothetical protein
MFIYHNERRASTRLPNVFVPSTRYPLPAIEDVVIIQPPMRHHQRPVAQELLNMSPGLYGRRSQLWSEKNSRSSVPMFEQRISYFSRPLRACPCH